jgi:two-component system, OmpR family, sensor histidine kinase KdpD
MRQGSSPSGSETGREYTRAGLAMFGALATVSVITGISSVAMRHRLPDIIMLYILGVVVVATRLGYAASLLAAALSVAAVDFFFTAPYYSFAVADPRLWLTMVVMFVVAVVIGNQTERIRRSATESRERERGTAKLYAISQDLSVARTSEDIVRAAQRHLRDIFASDVWVLLADSAGQLSVASGEQSAAAVPALALAIAARVMAGEALAFGLPTGDQIVALRSSTGMLGVLVIRPASPASLTAPTTRDLLEAFAIQIALSLERCKLSGDAQRAQVEVKTERLRNALLSSVSHDLRTPLAVVKATATALLEPGSTVPEARRREYLQTISDEATRLNSRVGNLLNMASLEAGALRARKEWLPLEETVGVALHRSDEQLKNRVVNVVIEPDAALASFDWALVEQVLVNLLENAARYTPEQTPIDIGARRVETGVEVTVADRGRGVPPGHEEQIFEKFHRAARTGGGMGLGLAICRGMIAAHDGVIWCENREGGGAAFRFILPCSQPPATNELPEIAESA